MLAAPGQVTPQGKRDRATTCDDGLHRGRVDLNRADLDDLRTEAGRLVLHVRGKGHTEADEVIVIAHAEAARPCAG